MLNKKNNFLKFIIPVVLVTGITGCKKDFLEVVPKGVAIATTTSDYELLLNDRTLTLVVQTSHIVMSDELAGFNLLYAVGAGIASISDQKAFEYQDDLYLPADKNSELTLLERQLYTYNKVINQVMDSKEGNEAQKRALKAEALAGRAWVHFMLVNYYGKPFSAATAATDPGIPLVTVADVTQTSFTRASVQAAYDLVIADLTTAIPDLPAKIIARGRMSKAAGEALLGKVYMYMQQFDKALPMLKNAIEHLASPGNVAIGLYDYNGAFAAGGAFFPVNPFTGPNRFNLEIDREVVYLKQFVNIYSYILSGIAVKPATAALFSKPDLRLNFFTADPYPPIGISFPSGMIRAYGRYTNLGISIPDIYLLKAECEARNNQLADAVTGLVAFRKLRMHKDSVNAADIPVAIANDQVALTKFILQERIREFTVTGERWWDMRRLSVDETYKSTIDWTHTVYDMAGNVTGTYPLKPERLTFRFPQYIMTANPGLQQNP